MSWETIPRADVIHSHFSDRLDTLTAEEGGYRRLHPPVTHRRSLFFLKKTGLFLILDKLSSEGEQSYDLHYHFPPETGLELREDGRSYAAPEENALLFVDCSRQAVRSIIEGDDRPLGWYSPGYGRLTRTSTVEVSCRGAGTILFFSVLMPWSEGSGAVPSVIAEEDGEGRRITVDCEHERVVLSIHQRISDRTEGGLSYRGRALLIQEDRQARDGWAYAVDCERLSLKTDKLFESPEPRDTFKILPDRGGG
jgi:hypothetical protein